MLKLYDQRLNMYTHKLNAYMYFHLLVGYCDCQGPNSIITDLTSVLKK